MDKVRARGCFYIGYNRLEDEEALKEDLRYWKELGDTHSDSHLVLGKSVKLYIEGLPNTHTCLMFEVFIKNAVFTSIFKKLKYFLS